MRLLSYIKDTAPSTKNTVISKKRGKLYEEMQHLLSLWVERQTHEHIPIRQTLIQVKALSLYADLCKKYPEEENVDFKASSGWFMRFKQRHSLHNMKVQGESASADIVATAEFPATLANLIEKNGFLPEQIFNIDETGLFWKRMPDLSFIEKEEKTLPGFKAAKNRLTLMLGGNCSGDIKLKPLLVYHSQNPRALKNINQVLSPSYLDGKYQGLGDSLFLKNGS